MGIDADVLALLSRRLGVKFELVPTTDWSEACQRAIKGGNRPAGRHGPHAGTRTVVSLHVALHRISRGHHHAQRHGLSLVRIRSHRPDRRRSARLRDHAELAREYPEVRLRYTENMGQAFELVSEGAADAVVTNLANASFIIKTRGLTNLKIAGIMARRFELRYAVRQELIGILDKGIASLSRADLQAPDHRWIRVDYARVIRWDLVWKTAAGVRAVPGGVLGFLLWHTRTIRTELARRKAVQHELEEGRRQFAVRTVELLPVLRKTLLALEPVARRKRITFAVAGLGWARCRRFRPMRARCGRCSTTSGPTR